jgi:DNA-directed RNA polymerase subunit RPC12/RpoP
VSDLSYTCPHCRAKIQAESWLAGREAYCPACGGPVTVPGDPPPVQVPPKVPHQPPPPADPPDLPTAPGPWIGWGLFIGLTAAELVTLMNSWSAAHSLRTSWLAVYVAKFFFLDKLNFDMLAVVMLTVASCVWVATDVRRPSLPAWLFAIIVFRPLGLFCYLVSRDADRTSAAQT